MLKESQIKKIHQAIDLLEEKNCFNCASKYSNDYYVYDKTQSEIHSEIFKIYMTFEKKDIETSYSFKYLNDKNSHVNKSYYKRTDLLYVEDNCKIKIHYDIKNLLRLYLFRDFVNDVIVTYSIDSDDDDFINDFIVSKVVENKKYVSYRFITDVYDKAM